MTPDKKAIVKAGISTILLLGAFAFFFLAIDLITEYKLEGIVCGSVMSIIIVSVIFKSFYNSFKHD